MQFSVFSFQFSVKVIIALLSTVFIFHAAGFRFQASCFAQENVQSAALKVTQTANERLKAKIEQLTRQIQELKERNSRLSTAGGGGDLADKLKTLTEQNSRIKDNIVELETALVNSDNARKLAETENKILAEKLQDPNKQPESLREIQTELDAYKNKSEQLEKDLSDLKGKTAEAEINSQPETIASSPFENLHYNQGVRLQKENKIKDALKAYEEALKTNPEDGDAHYNLGLIYETKINDRNKAIYHYGEYLRINPFASDAFEVKEAIADMTMEKSVWGEPDAKGIREKMGRFY